MHQTSREPVELPGARDASARGAGLTHLFDALDMRMANGGFPMRSMVRVVLCWMTVAGMLAACGAAVPPIPGKGGPAWLEVTSEHFTVWTDADRAQVRELVQQMEHLRQVVIGVAFPSVPADGRVLVVALRDDDELAAFSKTGQPRALAMTAGAPLWQPTIVLSAFSTFQTSDRTVAHELTHVISFAVVHHQPRWLAEGMAEFFETVRLDPDRGTADVGVAPEYRGSPLRMAHLIPISKLFEWNEISEHEEREYSTAWALFTFLINVHQRELAHYLQLLHSVGSPCARSTADQAAAIWREAFPSLPLAEVDNELRQWLVTGSHVVMHFNVQLRDWPIAERALGDADVYAARGAMRALITDRRVDARADATAALAAEPANVLARLLVAALDRAEPTVDQVRAMTAAHRDDWRAWWVAAHVLSAAHGDAAEIADAQRTACALFARNPALLAPSELCAGDRAASSSP